MQKSITNEQEYEVSLMRIYTLLQSDIKANY